MYKELILKKLSKFNNTSFKEAYLDNKVVTSFFFIFNKELREEISSLDLDNSIFKTVNKIITYLNNQLNVEWTIDDWEKKTIPEITELYSNRYFDLIDHNTLNNQIDISLNNFEFISMLCLKGIERDPNINPNRIIEFLEIENANMKKTLSIITIIYSISWYILLYEEEQHEVLIDMDLLLNQIIEQVKTKGIENIDEILNVLKGENENVEQILKILKNEEI